MDTHTAIPGSSETGRVGVRRARPSPRVTSFQKLHPRSSSLQECRHTRGLGWLGHSRRQRWVFCLAVDCVTGLCYRLRCAPFVCEEGGSPVTALLAGLLLSVVRSTVMSICVVGVCSCLTCSHTHMGWVFLWTVVEGYCT